MTVPTIISPKASNWVDRGEPPHATIQRVLARFLDGNPASDPEWFRLQSDTIVGMVAADATEVHVAGFLDTLIDPSVGATRTRLAPLRSRSGTSRRPRWVRDFAERVLQGEIPPNRPTPDSLSHWLAARLLTPEQLSDFEGNRDR